MRVRSWKRLANWEWTSWMSVNSERCYNRGLMKKAFIGLVLLLTVSNFVTAQRGQPPKPPAAPATPPSKLDDQTISVEVNLVNLFFPVADRKGKFRSEERRVGKECRSRWS